MIERSPFVPPEWKVGTRPADDMRKKTASRSGGQGELSTAMTHAPKERTVSPLGSWSADERRAVLAYLDALDETDRAHADLMNAKRELKKTEKAIGTDNDEWEIKAEEETVLDRAWRDHLADARTREAALGAVMAQLTELGTGRKAGRGTLRARLKEAPPLAEPDVSENPPAAIETVEPNVRHEPESEALRSHIPTETARVEPRPIPASAPTDAKPEAVTQVVPEKNDQPAPLLDRIRRHPLSRQFVGFLTALTGIAALSVEPARSADTPTREETILSEPHETEGDEAGKTHEAKLLDLKKIIASGTTSNEYEARYGREGWSQQEKIEYEQIPTLFGKFEYLHKDNMDVVNAGRDSQSRVENFAVLFKMMGHEFGHSRLAFDFAERTIRDAVHVLPTLPPEEALDTYTKFSRSLAAGVGYRHVRELAQGLTDALPDGHPVRAQIDQDAWLSPDADEILKPSKRNQAVFDQATGRISIYHKTDSGTILLDVFPGNGGPPNGVEWKPGLPAEVAVRTPDGEFTFARAFEKKSASWVNSWVTDTAPLRWGPNKATVEYQDTDGAWRTLTGEDAEFMVNGAPEKPFKMKGRSTLYRAASHLGEDGQREAPKPFTIDSVIDGQTDELRPTWDNNDFGPQSIKIRDRAGRDMPIFFHSSPTDEGPQEFLDFSHGCIHVKPGDILTMSTLMVPGSKIQVSSGGLKDT